MMVRTRSKKTALVLLVRTVLLVLAAVSAGGNASRCSLDFQECSKYLSLPFFLFSFPLTHAHYLSMCVPCIAKGTEDADFCSSFKELRLQKVFFDVDTFDGKAFITCLFVPSLPKLLLFRLCPCSPPPSSTGNSDIDAPLDVLSFTGPQKLRKLSYLRVRRLGAGDVRLTPTDDSALQTLIIESCPTKALTFVTPEKYTQLHTLEINDIEDTNMPASLFSLPSLTSLTMKNCKFMFVPGDIARLTMLESLTLDRSTVSVVHTSLCTLSSLQTLSLSGTKLMRLPNCIGNLTNLVSFNIGNNWIFAIPDSFGQLTKLEYLFVVVFVSPCLVFVYHAASFSCNSSGFFNAISSLPDSFGNLSSLRTLDLMDNFLVKLPDSFTNLKQLTTVFVFFPQ